MLAVYEGHLECARLLLDAKADFDAVDPLGRTALHYAVAQGQLECTRLLLSQGSRHSHRDHGGKTPLLLLAAENDKDHAEGCIGALLAAGASINEEDDQGHSPLWIAAHEGDTTVLEALCSREECNKDALDENGETALMSMAEWATDCEKVKVLVASGANVHLQSPLDGRNALAIAVCVCNCSAAEILLKAGSDLSVVVPVTRSEVLIRLKEGLEDMLNFHAFREYHDLVKPDLEKVKARLAVLKQAGDPLVALTPNQKRRLVNWAHAAKHRIRSRRKHKSVSFATFETPETHINEGEDESSGSEASSFSDST